VRALWHQSAANRSLLNGGRSTDSSIYKPGVRDLAAFAPRTPQWLSPMSGYFGFHLLAADAREDIAASSFCLCTLFCSGESKRDQRTGRTWSDSAIAASEFSFQLLPISRSRIIRYGAQLGATRLLNRTSLTWIRPSTTCLVRAAAKTPLSWETLSVVFSFSGNQVRKSLNHFYASKDFVLVCNGLVRPRIL